MFLSSNSIDCIKNYCHIMNWNIKQKWIEYVILIYIKEHLYLLWTVPVKAAFVGEDNDNDNEDEEGNCNLIAALRKSFINSNTVICITTCNNQFGSFLYISCVVS